MSFSIEVAKKGKNRFIASCPELNLEMAAETREGAVRRMEKVLIFYLNSAKEMGIESELLNFTANLSKRAKKTLN